VESDDEEGTKLWHLWGSVLEEGYENAMLYGPIHNQKMTQESCQAREDH
jgi:hypothetical protein